MAKKELVQIEYAEFALGEREYKVPAAGLSRSEVWRALFQEEVDAILELLKSQDIEIDLGNLKALAGADVMSLLPVAGSLFARLNVSMSQLANLITSYNLALEKDADYIYGTATTKQAIFALKEILALEYPFGSIFQQAVKTQNGRLDGTILKS